MRLFKRKSVPTQTDSPSAEAQPTRKRRWLFGRSPQQPSTVQQPSKVAQQPPPPPPKRGWLSRRSKAKPSPTETDSPPPKERKTASKPSRNRLRQLWLLTQTLVGLLLIGAVGFAVQYPDYIYYDLYRANLPRVLTIAATPQAYVSEFWQRQATAERSRLLIDIQQTTVEARGVQAEQVAAAVRATQDYNAQATAYQRRLVSAANATATFNAQQANRAAAAAVNQTATSVARQVAISVATSQADRAQSAAARQATATRQQFNIVSARATVAAQNEQARLEAAAVRATEAQAIADVRDSRANNGCFTATILLTILLGVGFLRTIPPANGVDQR